MLPPINIFIGFIYRKTPFIYPKKGFTETQFEMKIQKIFPIFLIHRFEN